MAGKSRRAIGALTTLLMVLATIAVANPAEAQVSQRITVDTTVDSVDASPGDGTCADADGQCSLRAAIQEADASGEVSQLTLPAGAYTFVLANAEVDEEASASGDLDITSDIRISGFGATINPNGLDRAFDVAEGGSLTLSGVTITNGFAAGGEDPIVGSGGAIANAGTTMLQLVTFTNNRAEGPAASGGAVLNTGTMMIRFSTFESNQATRAGGAIEANGGSTTIVRSTFNANSTGAEPGNGGALHLSGAGDVVIDDSTFTSNTASAEGGALWNSEGGNMTVTKSTISGNSATGAEADQGGGGLFNDGGEFTVDDSVIENNVANGAAGSGGGILNDAGTLTVTNTDITNNTSNRAGGGIEANVGTTNLDAVLMQGNTTGAAPGNGGGFHITGAGDATITNSQVVANTASAEGGGLWNGAGTMTISDTRISDNVASGAEADQGGGGVFNAGGTVVMTNGSVDGNDANGAAGSGGGILNDQGSLQVEGTSISRNTSLRAGGGIEANVGSTDLVDVELLQNWTGSTPGNGGGLHITGAGDATVTDSNVLFNTAASEGGGLWNGAGTMTVTNTLVSHNFARGAEADQGGGGLFNAGGTLIVEGGSIIDNDAEGTSGSGGGILNDQGDLTVTKTTIARNSALRAGGGIEAVGGAEGPVGTTTLVDAVLSWNDTGAAPGNGGGLHLSANGTVDVDGGRVTGNFAVNEGGGLWNSAVGTMTVDGTNVSRNSSPVGPDLFTQPGGSLTVDGTAFVG